MSLKRRILPVKRKSVANAPPPPMKSIRLPDHSRGMRINCPGLSVMVTRTEEGVRVEVFRVKNGKHDASFACTMDTTIAESKVCKHGGAIFSDDCKDCGAKVR